MPLPKSGYSYVISGDLKDDEWAEYAQHKDFDVRNYLLQRADLPDSIFEILVHDKEFLIRAAVAKKATERHVALLDTLAEDPEIRVLPNVAMNIHTSQQALIKLFARAKAHSSEVHGNYLWFCLLNNNNLPMGLVSESLNSESLKPRNIPQVALKIFEKRVQV